MILKDKKIIICIVVIVISIAFLVIINSFKSNSSYLILDNEIIYYDGNKYKQVDIKNVEDKSFRIVSQKVFLGEYDLIKVDSEINQFLFKSKDEAYLFSMPLLGIQNNVDYISYKTEDFNSNDLNELNKIYNGNDIKKVEDLTIANKIVIDLDDNNIDDVIYSVYVEFDDMTTYSTVFVKLNNKVEVLAEEYGNTESNLISNVSYMLEYILDINNDDKLELIISEAIDDITNYSIYSLNNEYKEVYYTSIGG